MRAMFRWKGVVLLEADVLLLVQVIVKLAGVRIVVVFGEVIVSAVVVEARRERVRRRVGCMVECVSLAI